MTKSIFQNPKYTDSSPEEGDQSLSELGLTVVTPFYNSRDSEKRRFEMQYHNCMDQESRVKDKVKFLFVDDGSPEAILNFLGDKRKKHLDFNLTIYRINENLRGNQMGAINLGVTESTTDWVQVIDSDCFFRPPNLNLLLDLKPKRKYIYRPYFERIFENGTKIVSDSSCIYINLMHKQEFIKIGGWDEDFVTERSGGYCFADTHFSWKVGENGYKICSPIGVVVQEYVPEAIGGNFENDRNMREINKKILRKKQRGEIPSGTEMLRGFTYSKVFEHVRQVKNV